MITTIKDGESDQKAMSENSFQAMLLKNQKLEAKLRELDNIKKDNHELKAQRDKQQ